ncbi:MAG: DUF502 domain-containing protein [Pirellulales bacterium]
MPRSLATVVQRMVQVFLAGVFAVLPLVITVAVALWVVDFLGSFLGPDAVLGRGLQRLGVTVAGDTALAYVAGWVIVLAAIFGLGVLVQMGARRLMADRVDRMVRHVPILGGVYGTARQLVGMMDKKDQADLKGMSVVFCQFGAEGGAAFLALLPTPERFRVGELDYHAVLVPTAPFPVGGSLVFVPVDSVRPADLSVDAFMSIYISMGVTGPEFLKSDA